jgi:hypothetical protein
LEVYTQLYILRTSHVNKDNSAIGMQVLASGFSFNYILLVMFLPI